MADEKNAKETSQLPSYVVKKGDAEVVDLSTAVSQRRDDKDPACHALICLLSMPGRELTDFGFDPKATGDERTKYEVSLSINGVSTSFCELVDRLYRNWQEDIDRAAQKKVDDLAGEKMRELEDDIQTVRDHLRSKFSGLFPDDER